MTRPFPSVDRVIRSPLLASALAVHGRAATVEAIREVAQARRDRRAPPQSDEEIAGEVRAVLERRAAPPLRRVFNLSGVVLHTNLGRARLSERAIQQASVAMREAVNLEFDLETGGRGERDDLVEGLLTGLTGAQAATVVNNNAAAVLLVLAALAAGREAVVSRGELVEIGGAFRIPDVMRTAGARLVEVGTTNRTHARDYEAAIGAQTALLMKVHASNYRIEGFTAAVPEREVAEVAHANGLPFVVDLGAGSLVDLSRWRLPREPTVQEALAAGADLVAFSGDKLMGGPQCGLIVGRSDLMERLRRHPLKRALRVGKPTLAALEATLQAYRDPQTLAAELPTFRLLTRPVEEIAAAAARLAGPLASALGAAWGVECANVKGQVGSGSLPLETLPSVALAISPVEGKPGGRLDDLAARLRALPIPVVGRIAQDRLLLDLRCLDDEPAFLRQLDALRAC